MAHSAPTTEYFDCRNAFSQTLESLAQHDDNIVAIVNDSVGSSKLGGFREQFPDRLFNVGIAEQTLVGVGAGFANGGKIPFVSAASCFLTGRALEQVKADVAYSNVNVKLVGQSSGVAYGELGPTHHSIEDFAWLRPLNNLLLICPADPWETTEAMRFACQHDGPVYLRLSRMPVPALEVPDRVFRIGKAERLRQGSDVAIIACGTTVHIAVAAARSMAEKGIEAQVLNMSTISPLDEEAIITAAQTGAIVTIEEHSVRGGLGGAVAECVSEHCPVPVERIGFPGFLPTGSVEWLFERYGLSVPGIEAAADRAMRKKTRQ